MDYRAIHNQWYQEFCDYCGFPYKRTTNYPTLSDCGVYEFPTHHCRCNMDNRRKNAKGNRTTQKLAKGKTESKM